MTVVRVPGSSANLGPGFDGVGMALGIYAEVGLVGHSDDGFVMPANARVADDHHPATVAFRAAGGEGTVIGAIGDRAIVAGLPLEAVAGVERVVPLRKEYKRVSREFRSRDTVVTVQQCKVGGGHFAMMGGPCSIESYDQTLASAQAVKAAGGSMLRGGAYKPRTSPYAFQGLGLEGLRILRAVGDEVGLPITTELMDVRDLGDVVDHVDMIWIGARNMQNFNLLSEVGRSGKPVMLKRGMSATIEIGRAHV